MPYNMMMRLDQRIRAIVRQCLSLRSEWMGFDDANSIDYVGIFAQTDQELNEFRVAGQRTGVLQKELAPGSEYLTFWLRKPFLVSDQKIDLIRLSDQVRSDGKIGYVDFVVDDWKKFKEKYLRKPGFKLVPVTGPGGIIEEMLELSDPSFPTVSIYFPDVPLGKDLGLRN